MFCPSLSPRFSAGSFCNLCYLTVSRLRVRTEQWCLKPLVPNAWSANPRCTNRYDYTLVSCFVCGVRFEVLGYELISGTFFLWFAMGQEQITSSIVAPLAPVRSVANQGTFGVIVLLDVRILVSCCNGGKQFKSGEATQQVAACSFSQPRI